MDIKKPQLLSHLKRTGKRFVLTAGLITSVCVFLTTASAVQQGFLAAIVEDCCADEPHAHAHTLERYSFMFDRTALHLVAQRHAEWSAWLAELETRSIG